MPPRSLENSRTGVFVALSTNDYWNLQVRQNDLTQISAYHGSGIAYSVASGRLSYVFGLQGPSISIDTACSGSLVTVHLACQSLRSGECRMALAGGVNLILSPDNSVIFAKTKMLAADGRCKTFDAAADGFGEGEGCGLVVLKRLSDAVADGNTILAVIRGSAVNQDGPSSGLTAPNGPSQEAVIREALAAAAVKPGEVGYVEAHGTGTSLGDPIEVQALAAVLGENRAPETPLWIGSVKTNLGHLEAAAGISGLIKVVLALRHKTIPPHLHFQTPNPFIPWAELPVAVPTSAVAWPELAGRRIAGVSAFGFSGTNAHVVLEEAPEAPLAAADAADRPVHILALSGADAHALRDLAARHAALLGDASLSGEARLADICWSANAGRSHEPQRLAIVAPDAAEMRAALASFLDGEKPADATAGVVEAGERPKIAFLFTGQGSQYAGMGQALYRTQPVFREALARCSEILKPHLDRPLESILFPTADAAELLHQTQYTQPALFALEYALAELWRSWGVRPFALLGHSLGEYVAAVTAGVWRLEDGLALVAARARLMQGLPAGGAMAAVFAGEAEVAALLRSRPGVAIAAVNGPQNVVISGDAAGVGSAVEELKAAGVKAQPLTVSHAFHSPLMEPVLDRFEALAGATPSGPAGIRIASNLSGSIVRGGGVFDGGYWRRHMRQPVRFADGIAALYEAGVRVFLEIGPNPTLAGMGRRAIEAGDALWLPSLARGREDWPVILGSLAQLYSRGVEVDWQGFDGPYRRNRVAIPTYPFQRRRHWFEKKAVAGQASAVARTPATAGFQQHPLLQRRLRAAVGLFESDLGCATLPWVAEHRVRGRVVLPATAYLEAARAAAAAVLGCEQLRLEGVAIGEALVLPDEGSRTVQIVVTPGSRGEASFQIFSAPGSGMDADRADSDEADAWRLHASGRATVELPAAGLAESGSPDAAARERCNESQDVDEHYRAMAERGIELGASFRGVAALRSGGHEAQGELRLTEEARSGGFAYGVHPVLLDAALQVVGAALAGKEAQGTQRPTYLPMGFDRVDFHAVARGERATSHVQLRPLASPDPETVTADIRLLGESGELLVEVSGLHLKKMPSGALSEGGIEDWLYEVQWQEQELAAGGTGRVSPRELHEVLGEALPPLLDRATMSRYDELVPRLEAIGGAWVVRAFVEMGCKPRVGELLTAATLADSLGVIERHQRYFGRLLAILGEDGFLEAQGPALRVMRELEARDPAAELESLLAAYPEYEAEIALLGRCGPHLAGVLRGRVDPLELLFPGGDTSTAERLYEQSPLARAYNGLVRAAVVAAAEKLRAGRKVRILEIGGGTGGTTSGLLPALSAAHTEYVFTDISRLFTTKAEQKYRQYPFVRYRTLDIEQDPAAQGFDGEPFDIVVAANVLHATRDLSETLSHVRGLLSPDGVLVALEMVRMQRDIDLVFGLTDGWWRFTDSERRASSLLMTPPSWLELLGELEFRDAVAVPSMLEEESRAVNQTVLVAGGAPAGANEAAAGGSASPGAAWLIFEDQAGDSRGLTAAIAARGEKVVSVRRGAAFGSNAEGHFVVNATSADDYKRLREAAFPAGRRCRGIVHLWSLDASSSASLDAGALDAEQALGARSVLNLVQAFGGVMTDSGRLSLVTRGAQAMGGEQDLCVSQAPLWGLAKVIALEHPELRCLRIDLDPAHDPDDRARLAAEVFANTREDQVMLRGGKRHVARLARAARNAALASGNGPVAAPSREVGARATLSEASLPVRYEVGTRGLLDSVVSKPMTRRAPDAGEVEIRVAATGLNMRDVLGAMGLYPGDPGPLGSECAGTITAVGPGVAGLEVGDEVLAIAAGCLASYVTAPAHFVVRRPPGLSVEQASSVAIPYVTAHFALLHVGRLRAGERVLIHSAAGGVGLAAVNLARRIGAEVVATAGNEEKRAYLRSLGIEVVLDSRSTAFAAAIRNEAGGRGIDVVLNSLGPEFVEPGLAVLAPGGRFVEIAKTGILNAEQIAALPAGIEYHVVDWSVQARETPSLIRGMLDEVMALLAVGDADPLPVRTFPAREAVTALRFMGNARHIGKLVLVQETAGPGMADRAAGEHAGALRLRPDATYLITGGLRGLGLLVAERFVERGARHLVLMGRSEPSAAAREAIERIEARGARVVTARADVSQSSEVERELANAATLLPPIAGVVHSAGVLNDGVLQRLDWARFSEVLAPKVGGTWNLYQSLRGQPLDFFVCFSSIAGLFGSAGQANHAAANAFLDTFASFLRTAGIPGQSINWGAWAEVGAAAERNVGERVSGRGVEEIAPALGLDALEMAMRRGGVQIAVTPMRWGKFLEPFEAGAEPPFFSAMAPRTRRVAAAAGSRPAAKPQQPVLERVRNAPAGKRHGVLVGYVSEQVARVLGLGEADVIDQRQPLTDMGLDSLMAVELRNLLGPGLGLERSLPATIVYDYPSVREMAAFLETQLPFDRSGAAAPGPADGPAEANRAEPAGTGSGGADAGVLDDIEQLSDEEVERLFAERVGSLEKQ